MRITLREISGRGLAVCDYYDAMRMRSVPTMGQWVAILMSSARQRRAVTRYVIEQGQLYAALLKEAQGG